MYNCDIFKYEQEIYSLKQEIKEEQKKHELFNQFLIQLLEVDKIKRENEYLKEQLKKLSVSHLSVSPKRNTY